MAKTEGQLAEDIDLPGQPKRWQFIWFFLEFPAVQAGQTELADQSDLCAHCLLVSIPLPSSIWQCIVYQDNRPSDNPKDMPAQLPCFLSSAFLRQLSLSVQQPGTINTKFLQISHIWVWSPSTKVTDSKVLCVPMSKVQSPSVRMSLPAYTHRMCQCRWGCAPCRH